LQNDTYSKTSRRGDKFIVGKYHEGEDKGQFGTLFTINSTVILQQGADKEHTPESGASKI
jgi:hypothetical protein